MDFRLAVEDLQLLLAGSCQGLEVLDGLCKLELVCVLQGHLLLEGSQSILHSGVGHCLDWHADVAEALLHGG